MSAAPRTAVMANAGSALLVERLTVRRSSRVVVDGVSLEVKPLELHGLAGPNGAGKTSLLEAIAGFVASDGDVYYGGVPLDREQRAQHVFLVPNVVDDEAARIPFADERVRDVLAFAASSLGAVDASRVEIDDVNARVRDLGRGERKRFLIALGLLVPRGFVLIDEPFDGLDAQETRALTNLLRTSTSEKRAIVCALHHLGEAEKLCDRFTLLDHGKVKASGQIHELRERAKTHPGASLDEVFVALA
jgi:ABC-type multidrug transport system ATPase subunit